ncbi:DUF4345 domain-containing protein [Pedobacter sp. ASV1-7]|uniref:DUF4345 domain-containing protein n=1 Tax=Pedobacter sp. ASV1-7 TaxID=3145237 RepID=UPI0032E88C55
MNTKNKIIGYLGHGLVLLSLLSLVYVSFMAWLNPREVMALVREKLTNTDSLSSIRGVYGGTGLFVVSVLCYLWSTGLTITLRFLSMFWLLYSVSRVLTWAIDGPLGEFGTQWLVIELFFGISCLTLSYLVTRHR